MQTARRLLKYKFERFRVSVTIITYLIRITQHNRTKIGMIF